MANDFDNTALNSAVRELWEEKLQEARYAEGVMFSRVLNESTIAKTKGDVIHITVDQKYTVGTVSAAGAFTPQNYTLSTVDITMNQWEQVAIRVLDRAQSQSFWTPTNTFPTQVGKALGARYDEQLAALHSSITAQVGSVSTPGNFDKSLMQEGMLKLASTNIPLDDLYLFIHPVAYWNGLTNEIQLVSADAAGLASSVTRGGKIRTVYDVPLFQSTNIVNTNGSPPVYKNLLLHKTAMAIAWQRDAEIEKVRGTAGGILADIAVAQALYGLSVIRADHGVVINSAV